MAPQLQYIPFPFPLLKANEEKGGDTPVLISPPSAPILGPEMMVAGKPVMMSIPIPLPSRGEMARPSSRSEPEKRDKEAGNPPSSFSSSFSFSSLPCNPWTRVRGNACSSTGVCNGLVSGVLVNDEGEVFPSLLSSLVVGVGSVGGEVVGGELERVPPLPAQEEEDSTNP